MLWLAGQSSTKHVIYTAIINEKEYWKGAAFKRKQCQFTDPAWTLGEK